MQALSGHMAWEVSTESATGPTRANSSSPDPWRGWGTSRYVGLLPPSPTRVCQQRQAGSLLPTRSALFPPWEEGPSGLPRGAVVELGGHSLGGGEGSGQGCSENLFGLGVTGNVVKRDGRRGYWGFWPLTGHSSKGRMPRSGIRFLWTQCAQGGMGSRLSSPRYVGGWVCWHPPQPRAPAASAPAAGCAGTSPHSSAAAASGTR